MRSFVQVTSCHFHYNFIKSLFPNFVMIFFIKTWMETMIDSYHCDGDKFPHHILYKFSKIFQIIRNISVPVPRKWQMPESTHCKEMPLSFKLLLLQLGFKCSAAADKLRFILSGPQCLRAFNQAFPLFFWLFLLQNARKSADISKNVHFSSCLGRPMETSWRNAASRHRDNVHVYDKWPVWR